MHVNVRRLGLLTVLSLGLAGRAAAQGDGAVRDRAESFRQTALSHYERREADSAIANFKAALGLFRMAGDRAMEARVLTNIGGTYQETDRPDSAVAYFRAALPLLRELGDADRERVALVSVGVAYRALGRTDSARTYLSRALPVVRQRGDLGGEAQVLGFLGELELTRGLPDAAVSHFRAALPILRRLGAAEAEATTLDRIGQAHLLRGRPDSALLNLRAALTRRRSLGDRVGEAVTLGNIAGVQQFLGRPDSAVAYARAALGVARAAGNPRFVAGALNRLSSALFEHDLPEAALAAAEEARRIHQSLGDRDDEAEVSVNIAALHGVLGRHREAIVALQDALAHLRKAGNRRGEAAVLRNLGQGYLTIGRADSGVVALAQSVAVSRDIGDREGEAEGLTQMARAHLRVAAVRDPRRAAALLDTASAVVARIRAGAGPERDRIAFAERTATITELWAAAWLAQRRIPRDPRSTVGALAAVERGRAQALLDVLQRGHTSASADGTGGNARDRLARPGADLPAEANGFLAPLRRTRTAALSYLVGDDTLRVWRLTPDGTLTLAAQRAIGRDSLAVLVQRLRWGLGADDARGGMTRSGAEQEATVGTRGASAESEGDASFDEAARQLAAVLVPPEVLAGIPARADVVLVPHGVLGLVPFAALPIGADGTPMGARYALRYAPSLASLAARPPSTLTPRARRTAFRQALVVGNPVMPAVETSTGGTETLRPLPGAEVEGTRLAAQLGTTALTGAVATESTVRARLASAPLVHLATHGLAYGSEARVRASYVALAPDDAHDGLLTLGELSDDPALSLTAELVVLSACQTGLGDLKQAEGTVGLQRGLLARGARSVLVSLWSVDDAATALLMARFYAHWLHDSDAPAKAEALRRAQRDVRATTGFEHPRFWAAFQLVGAN